MSGDSFMRTWFPTNCESNKLYLLDSEEQARYCARHNMGFYILTAVAILFIIVLIFSQAYKTAAFVVVVYGVIFMTAPFMNAMSYAGAKAEIDGYVKTGLSREQAAQEYIKNQNNMQLMQAARGQQSQPGVGTGIGLGFGASLGNAAGNVLGNALFGDRR